MSHLSLYRRFRPDTFDKIVRQEHVVRILKNQIEANAVGHAYLFTGPRGTGKTSVARIFARAACCEHPVDGSPCGVCASCKALAAGSLDITEIDAASNNGVNEMRDLREKVQYPPVSGRYKVYIIDEVHMLTDAAFNALLKTLEEPPAHAVFILATTEPQKLPATILSRCMRLDFKLIPEKDLEAHLRRILDEIGKEYDDEAVAAIARAGAGSDRDMLSVAEACIVYADKLTYGAVCAVLGAADVKETARLVKSILEGKGNDALLSAEAVLREGKAVGVLLKDVIEFLNRVTVCVLCGGEAENLLSLPSDLFRTVQSVARAASPETVLRATEIFVRVENELRFSSSPRISFEAAVLRAATPAADLDVSALRARIDLLEKELARLKETGLPAQTAPAAPAPITTPAPAVTTPAPVTKPEPAPVAASEPDPGPEMPPFDEQEPIFAEAYFSDGPVEPAPVAAPAARPSAARTETSPAPPKPAPPKPAPAAPAPAREGRTAEQTFGAFIRYIRRELKNGVLFTMCSELVPSFEGETFVLETDSPGVCGALNRADNKKLIGEILAQMGISDFVVRLIGETPKRDPVEELRRNFPDYPIEIK